MMNAIKAELRKLFTTRSTYVLTGIAFALLALVGFYFEGYNLHGESLQDKNLMTGAVTGSLNSPILILMSIVGILLVTHEYRYNTILYSLTSSNSRAKVLFAKLIVLSAFALVFTALVAVLAPALGYLGIHAHGNHLIAQDFSVASLAWRSLAYGWATMMISFIIAMLVRNQVGSIVALFVLPTLEITLTQLLKSKATAYFPNASSNEILEHPMFGTLSYAHAAMVCTAYIVVGTLVALLLFKRRDAN